MVRRCKTFLRTLVLLRVLFPTSKEWAFALQVQWWRNSKPSSKNRFDQLDIHLGALWHRSPMLVQDFSRFENSIRSLSQSVATITTQIASVEQVAASQLALPRWKLVQSQPLAFLDRLFLGLYLEAPHPPGPVTQALLTKTEIQDADSTKTPKSR